MESEPPYLYVRGNPVNRIDPSGYQTGVGEAVLGGGVALACVATAPACGAAITAGAVVVGVTATGVIFYVAVDYLIQHPELYEVTYPAGQPQPIPAPAPPQTPPLIGTPPAPPFVSADGTRPISAVPGREPGGEPGPRPAPRPQPLGPDFVPRSCPPDNDPYGYKVLTLGDGNFSYSYSLHAAHPGWKISGTEYGNGSNSQTPRAGGIGNLKLYTNVDATRLGSGPVTGQNRYDAIVFNLPRAHAPLRPYPPHSQLIDDTLNSALAVLKPGGHIRFSSSGGMPATPQLQRRVKPDHWPSGYNYANGGPVKWHGGGDSFLYFNNRAFGVPYKPTDNNKQPLPVDWSKTYWYVFVK